MDYLRWWLASIQNHLSNSRITSNNLIKTNDQFTSLEESIHILNVINKNILRYTRALGSLPDYNVNIDIILLLNTMTFEHCCILIPSYFDEYHGTSLKT